MSVGVGPCSTHTAREAERCQPRQLVKTTCDRPCLEVIGDGSILLTHGGRRGKNPFPTLGFEATPPYCVPGTEVAKKNKKKRPENQFYFSSSSLPGGGKSQFLFDCHLTISAVNGRDEPEYGDYARRKKPDANSCLPVCWFYHLPAVIRLPSALNKKTKRPLVPAYLPNLGCRVCTSYEE